MKKEKEKEKEDLDDYENKPHNDYWNRFKELAKKRYEEIALRPFKKKSSKGKSGKRFFSTYL